MHPFSPHAPSSFARHNTPMPAVPTRERANGAATLATQKGRMRVLADPLDQLAAEVRSKMSVMGSSSHSHIAAEELKIRRPRRPAATRASFRTPPASR